MNNTQVKFKTTVSSNLTANDLLGKDCEGAFIYSSTAKKLYLFDGSQVIPIGKNIFQIDENNPNQNYEDNAFYTNNLGKLYFIFDGIKYEIARASDIDANNQSIQDKINALDFAIDNTNTTINALSEKVGNPGAIGDDTKKSTGIYEILDEKVNNIVFEGYKTEQANAFAAYKIEAENKFLSADEELFLTDGIFFENYEYASKDNKYVQWSTELNLPESDKKTGPCIVLTIKNSTTSNPTENTIIIPAGELVDVYTGRDTDTINMSVNGSEISANIKATGLIKSQSTDDVVLTVGTDNKITTSFNTANIINQDATNTVQLSVKDNVVSADVVIDNLIAITPDNAVYLTKNKDNKLTAQMSTVAQNALNDVTTTYNKAAENQSKIETLTSTLATYGINNPEENAKTVLGEGLIKTAISEETGLREDKDNQILGIINDNIGTYAYTAKTNDVAATSTASGYFKQVQNHIEGEAAEIRSELNATKVGLEDAIGSYAYTEKTANADAFSTASGYFAEVKSHIDTVDGELRLEVQNLNSHIDGLYSRNDDGTISGIIHEDINTLSSNVGFYEFVEAKPAEGEIPGVEAHYEATGYFDVAKTHLESEINKLNGLITTIDGTTIPALQQSISDLAGTDNTSTVANNAAAISDLADAAKLAYEATPSTTTEDGGSVTTYTLSDGYIKDYIDALAGENVGTNTVAGNAAAISEIAEDYMKASEAYTAENAKAITISNIKIVTRTETENPSGLCLEITYDDSAKEKSYYSISDLFTQTGFTTGMSSNYYTIKEANAEFLSANEELFLTDGVFNADYEYGEKDGKYYKWEENKGYEKKTGPCIVLTVKNSKKSEDTDFKESTIIIPASNLVDTYTENNTGHNIAVAVSGYTISADLDVANIIGSDATKDIVILEKISSTNAIKASLNSTFTDRITALEGREDTYTTGLTSAYAAESTGDGIDESFIIKLTQSGDKAPAEGSEVDVNILSDLNTYIATKDYATHSDSEAAAKTVYNQAIPAPEENEKEKTIYPLLARKGIQKTASSLTDELTESYSLMDAYLTYEGYLHATKVYGAVWNDYAEYRQTHHKVRPGQCVYEKGDGSLAISYERMMPGANIVSDTFGFAIGETDECKTPLAVSGRVLAYPYESKEIYNPGDAVCSGPNGTISKMTRAEIRDYPERIVGTVSEIPTYEVWGSGNIKVNGRIWIKVR